MTYDKLQHALPAGTWTWQPARSGCGHASSLPAASTRCSSTRPARCRWPTSWRLPAPPGTSSWWAIRSSSPSPATRPTRRERVSRHWSTSSAATRRCRRRGAALDQTWRMHPRLCQFTSEVFYDGKLTGVDGLERQTILGARRCRGRACASSRCRMRGTPTPPRKKPPGRPAGLRSPRPAVAGPHGDVLALGPAQILVVTPYNAQIRAIRDALRRCRVPRRGPGRDRR